MNISLVAEILILSTCSISTVACLIILAFYCKIKELRVEGFSTIILIIIGDLEWSTSNLI